MPIMRRMNPEAIPYDRRRASKAYARRAYAIYRRTHVERGVAMALKAAGLTPQWPAEWLADGRSATGSSAGAAAGSRPQASDLSAFPASSEHISGQIPDLRLNC